MKAEVGAAGGVEGVVSGGVEIASPVGARPLPSWRGSSHGIVLGWALRLIFPPIRPLAPQLRRPHASPSARRSARPPARPPVLWPISPEWLSSVSHRASSQDTGPHR